MAIQLFNKTYSSEGEFSSASKELQLDGCRVKSITVLWEKQTQDAPSKPKNKSKKPKK